MSRSFGPSLLSLVVPLFMFPGIARADDSAMAASSIAASGRTFHADVEVDPTAYILDGFSLHAGLGWNAFRLDLGVFAMAVPRAVHGQDGFDQSFDGYGLKFQWFPFHKQSGLFTGVDAGMARSLITRRENQLAHRDRQASVGIHGGYRLEITGGLYATAWLGLGYAVGTEEVVLDDRTFKPNPWTVFPAIHIGYHLR
jgi:hypothetical protein